MKHLSNQLSIWQVSSVNDPLQGVVEDVRIIAVVETPFQFFEVTVKMLRTDLVKRSDNRPLEERPHALDTVGVDIAHDPFLFGVIDGFMARVVIRDPQIRLEFVGVDRFGLVFDRAVDEVVQGVTPNVRDALKADLSTALDRASNPSLVFAGTPACTLRLPSHKGFVHFHDPEQRRAVKRVVTHGLADTVAQVPRRPVGGPECPLHLVGRHAFLGFTHQVDRREPLTQGKVGVLHDGSGHDTELVAATETIPLNPAFDPAHVHIAATRAANASGPP